MLVKQQGFRLEPVFAAYNFSGSNGSKAAIGGEAIDKSGWKSFLKILLTLAAEEHCIFSWKNGLDKATGKGTKAGPFDYLETKQRI